MKIYCSGLPSSPRRAVIVVLNHKKELSFALFLIVPYHTLPFEMVSQIFAKNESG